MRPPLSQLSGVLLLSAVVSPALAAAAAVAVAVPPPASPDTGDEPTPSAPVPACTATSTSGTGAFFDLRPDIALQPLQDRDEDTPRRPSWSGNMHADYKARGWDYGLNFTMNLCGAVVEPVSEVVGVEKSAWRNVSAYYTDESGKVVSIGQESMDVISRGRKLVLQYSDGSPCDHDPNTSNTNTAKKGEKRSSRQPGHRPSDSVPVPVSASSASSAAASDATARRKSTLISFHCDRDPSLHQAAVSFVGTPDQCAYFFEVRSQHACARAEPDRPGSVGPGGVFFLIFLIAVLVYVLGGVFYNRTVAHARGWRQLPNYSLWAGIWNTISDAAVSAFSCCTGLLPRRRGYRHLSSSPRGGSREDENRLIDQLDEEWED